MARVTAAQEEAKVGWGSAEAEGWGSAAVGGWGLGEAVEG